MGENLENKFTVLMDATHSKYKTLIEEFQENTCREYIELMEIKKNKCLELLQECEEEKRTIRENCDLQIAELNNIFRNRKIALKRENCKLKRLNNSYRDRIKELDFVLDKINLHKFKFNK